MSDEVLFKAESHLSRKDVAQVLEDVADDLRRGDRVWLLTEDDSMAPTPPSRLGFTVTFACEPVTDGREGRSLEFRFAWDESGGDGEPSDDV